MLKSEKKWSYIENDEAASEILADLHIEEITKKLLIQRGIKTKEAAQAFLKPNLDQLIAPEHLKDIEQTRVRIKTAIEKGERILVYGDYDADGVTSTTLMIEALEELGAYCDFYIPNRFTEGYGPNEEAFRQAKDAGVSVIITVDNGISAVHEANVAKELGIDLIITDHHEIQDELPDAFSIIHPKVSLNYEFKELAGVGVAFKLAQYLLGYFPEQYLDLVAIGTVADMVPLVSENRVLTKFGLDALTHTKRPGLIALKNLVNIEGEATETDIGFLIGPRLNAVGRLQDASLAVDLLRADDLQEAEMIAEEVQQLNQERQKIVTQITKEITDKLDEEDELPNVLIVSDPSWNEGVLGIVASQLVRRYDRPAIVLRELAEEGLLKGSARSIQAFDLFTHCMKANDLFSGFGGHAQAAGMTLPIENKEKLFEHLNREISDTLSEDDFKEQLQIAETLQITEMTEELVAEINALRPYGMGNEKPLFQIQGVPEEVRQLGQKRNHLKFQFNENNHQVEGIGFQKGHLFDEIAPHSEVEMVGELGINEWNGFRKVQMIIRDIQVNEWQLFDYRGRSEFPVEPELETTKVIYMHEKTKAQFSDFKTWHYNDIQEEIYTNEQIKSLVLCDLPHHLTELQEIIQTIRPERIYAYFYTEASSYLNKIPSREEFKKIYTLIYQRKTLHLANEQNAIIRYMNWRKETLEFVLRVFKDLQFIEVDGPYIKRVDAPAKQPLESSKEYQRAEAKRVVEEVLYYSSYNDLKQWFNENCFSSEKEEVLLPNGL